VGNDRSPLQAVVIEACSPLIVTHDRKTGNLEPCILLPRQWHHGDFFRLRSLPLAELQLLYHLGDLFGGGDTLMVLIEPGEFLHEAELLIVIWQALVLALKCIESHAYHFPSPLGADWAKPDQSSHIQVASFEKEEQPCSEISHRWHLRTP